MATFVDTNVWVYAYDRSSDSKRSRALELVTSPGTDWVVSTQVLAEFYWVVTRQLVPALGEDAARQATELAATLPVISTDASLVLGAIETAHEWQLSLWDALIVEAAVRGGCDTLLTEDMGEGQTIRGVTVVNPFA